MDPRKIVRNVRANSLSATCETESLLRGTGKDKPTRARSQSRFITKVNVTKELMERSERWRELAYLTCPIDGAWNSDRLLSIGLILLCGAAFCWFILSYDPGLLLLVPLKLEESNNACFSFNIPPSLKLHQTSCCFCLTPTSKDIDPFKNAALHFLDAQIGQKQLPHLHEIWQYRLAKVIMHPITPRLAQCLALIQIILPLFEIPHYLWDGASDNSWNGWRPTVLGGSQIDVVCCFFLSIELAIRYSLRDSCNSKSKGLFSSWWMLCSMPRTSMLLLMWFDLTIFFTFNFIYKLVWYRWSRAFAPFIFISLGSYHKVFLRGIARAIPYIVPIAIVAVLLLSYFAYMALRLFNCHKMGGPLEGLPLFENFWSSWVTMLRVFTSITAILDVEESYQNAGGMIFAFCIIYSLLIVVALRSIVVAIANSTFQLLAFEAYQKWKQCRARSLNLTYGLICDPSSGQVSFGAFRHLLLHAKPELSASHAELLFYMSLNTNGELESSQETVVMPPILEEPSSRDLSINKDGFFKLLALVDADCSWGSFERDLRREGIQIWQDRCTHWALSIISWSIRIPCTKTRVQFFWLLFNFAVLLQVIAQTIMAVHNPGGSINAEDQKMYFVSELLTLKHPTHTWSLLLNIVALCWYSRQYFSSFLVALLYHVLDLDTQESSALWYLGYTLLSSTRVLCLYGIIYYLQEMARRVILVINPVIQSLGVVVAFAYAGAVICFGWFGNTEIGRQSSSLQFESREPMLKRFTAFQHAIGFQNFPRSLITLIDVCLFSNWTIVMDAAVVVSSRRVAVFFYAFQVFSSLITQPSAIGYIVQSFQLTRVKETNHTQVTHFHTQNPKPG